MRHLIYCGPYESFAPLLAYVMMKNKTLAGLIIHRNLLDSTIIDTIFKAGFEETQVQTIVEKDHEFGIIRRYKKKLEDAEDGYRAEAYAIMGKDWWKDAAVLVPSNSVIDLCPLKKKGWSECK